MPYIDKCKEFESSKYIHRLMLVMGVGFDPCGFQFQLTRNRGIWGSHELKFKLTFIIFHIELQILE